MSTLQKRVMEHVESMLDITEHPEWSEENPDKAGCDVEWLRENVYTLALEYLRDRGAALQTCRTVARQVTNEMYPEN